jgi:hypothetical protein
LGWGGGGGNSLAGEGVEKPQFRRGDIHYGMVLCSTSDQFVSISSKQRLPHFVAGCCWHSYET